MRPISLSVLVCLCLLVMSGRAARVDRAVAAPAEAPPTESYRAVMLTVDAASWGMILLPSSSGTSEALELLVGVGGMVLGGPIIHLVHGNHQRGLGSLAMRTLVPAGMFVIGTYFSDDLGLSGSSEFGELRGGAVVAGGAIAVWQLVDGLFLAEKSAESPARTASWAPTLAPQPGGAVAGIVGVY